MSGTSTTISGLPAASSLNLVDKIPVDQITNNLSTTKYGTIAQILALANAYTLPTATTSSLGGIIVGNNLTIANGILSATAIPYTLPIASNSTLGGIIVGNNLTISNGILSASAVNTSLATISSPGIVQIGTGLNISTGVLSTAYGTGAGTSAQGNDSRIIGAAPLVSPTFTGTPATTTALTADNSTRIASTAFVKGQGYLTATTVPAATSSVLGGVKPDGTTIINSTGAISVAYGTAVNTAAQGNDSRFTGIAYLTGASFTGTTYGPTPLLTDNSTTFATTAYVTNKIASATAGVSTVLGNSGAITLTQLVTGGVAPLASPTFTGVVNIPANALISGYALLASPTFTGTPVVPGYLTTAIATSTYAPLASPTFTGIPIAPTATSGTSTTQIATTNFVAASFAPLASPTFTGTVSIPTGAIIGGYAALASPTFTGTVNIPATAIIAGYAPLASPTFTGVVNIPANALISGYALLASPALSGVPTAPTATFGTSTTQIATTAFVANFVASGVTGVSAVITYSGAVTLANLIAGGVAPLASPTFTGVPIAPTAANGTNTTQLATTAFVQNQIATGTAGVTSILTFTGIVTLPNLVSGGVAPLASPTFTGVPIAPTAAPGTNSTQLATTAFTAASFAPLAAPTFTGVVNIPANALISGYALLANPTFTGVPAGPTAAPGTSTTQIATTAFVAAAVTTSTTGVSSVLTFTGAVTLANLVTGGVAPAASPILTGTPTAPTAVAGTNTQQLANTAFVTGATAVLAPKASPTFTGTPVVPGYLTSALAATTYAPLANPTFTGTVNLTGATTTAATAITSDSSTTVATTAFVKNNLNNSVVGTLLAGNGTPGVIHSDTGGNVNILNAYPMPTFWLTWPVGGQIYQWVAPCNIILTGVNVFLNQAGTTNTVTFHVSAGGTNVPGLTAVTVTTAAASNGPTATTATTISAGSQLAIQFDTVSGTPNTNTTLTMTFNGTYG